MAIWEERRVFGSRARNLKEVMLGEEVPAPLEFSNKKRSRSVRIVKRDSRSIKTVSIEALCLFSLLHLLLFVGQLLFCRSGILFNLVTILNFSGHVLDMLT